MPFKEITLYKRGAKNTVRCWRVEVRDDQLRVVHGQVGGEMTASQWKTIKPTRVGTKSEASGASMARRQAEAMQKKMMEQQNYHLDPALIDNQRFFAPMLAQEYHHRKMHLFRWPVFVQPKIDGIRAVATREGMHSRKGKRFHTTAHIEDALAEVFEEWPDLVIDGELYDADMPEDFGEIQSLITKKNPSAEHVMLLEQKLKFFVFDCAGDAGDRAFDLRHGIIQPIAQGLQILGHPIVPVPTYQVGSLDDIDTWSQQFLQAGWEGTMIRIAPPNSGYHQTRSPLLLKKKEFYSREFKIVKLEEGEGNYRGMAKSVLLKTPDDRGRFSAGVKGKQPFLRQLWKDRELYRDGEATVKFQMFSKRGIPRFPVAVALFPSKRDY